MGGSMCGHGVRLHLTFRVRYCKYIADMEEARRYSDIHELTGGGIDSSTLSVILVLLSARIEPGARGVGDQHEWYIHSHSFRNVSHHAVAGFHRILHECSFHNLVYDRYGMGGVIGSPMDERERSHPYDIRYTQLVRRNNVCGRVVGELYHEYDRVDRERREQVHIKVQFPAVRLVLLRVTVPVSHIGTISWIRLDGLELLIRAYRVHRERRVQVDISIGCEPILEPASIYEPVNYFITFPPM